MTPHNSLLAYMPTACHASAAYAGSAVASGDLDIRVRICYTRNVGREKEGTISQGGKGIAHHPVIPIFGIGSTSLTTGGVLALSLAVKQKQKKVPFNLYPAHSGGAPCHEPLGNIPRLERGRTPLPTIFLGSHFVPGRVTRSTGVRIGPSIAEGQ